ncbi:hypothetical protein RJ639_006108 [Escallonia herrerae]|uniref:Exostosin GT47 domain-containing protein n=1 Tax=Escallonia herrerae TaxID=1293975 RepID=A0AA89AWX5_9ASTE|nr:hypothetical protein RJ639_006108 [Escallonia herrerae]
MSVEMYRQRSAVEYRLMVDANTISLQLVAIKAQIQAMLKVHLCLDSPVQSHCGNHRKEVNKEDECEKRKSKNAKYIPTGPTYWNASAFHRSYMEMEENFKIFVYEEGESPIFHYGPMMDIYAIEGHFIQNIEVSHFRTKDPNIAHVYFLPFSVTMINEVVNETDSHVWGPMKRIALDYVNLVAAKYPYWNRSRGGDHFMLACHDKGPEISFNIPDLHKNSIQVLCNANTSEGFNPTKDVSIPEIYLPFGKTDGMIGGAPSSQRSILVFFAGGVHGSIRPVLFKHWENKDKDVQVHQYLPKGVSYYGMIRKSKYCICASGFEVASPRMVEAFYMGCVPVLIKEHYVTPFSDVLTWKSFSVEISVEEIPKLKEILMGISKREYVRMQKRGVQVRRHFEVNSPPKSYDVFHMILYSIWLRRFNIKINGTNES